jgi:DNA-binding transcriptional LysR family regulator
MAIDVLTGMRVFTHVVDAGSFAKAADKLDLSRGMTSRYVAQIEAHLGVRLLNRTTRRLSLTETGNDYYQRATQVLALVDEAEHAAAHEAAQPSGTLRISTSVAFGARHAGGAISAYLQRYPEVRVDLTLNDRVVDLVEEGYDVAVRIARRAAERVAFHAQEARGNRQGRRQSARQQWGHPVPSCRRRPWRDRPAHLSGLRAAARKEAGPGTGGLGGV